MDMEVLVIKGEEFQIRDSGSVHFDSKDPNRSESEKAQARKNIGAVSLEEVLAALPNGEEVAY